MVFISICVKSAAAVYLIWMGIQGLKETNISFDADELEHQGFMDSLTASIVLTAPNPLVIIFYAGILPTILNVDTMSMLDIMVIIMVIVFVEAGTALAYCLPFALFRYKMLESLINKINIFSSVAVILIGLYIGYTALSAQDLMSVF